MIEKVNEGKGNGIKRQCDCNPAPHLETPARDDGTCSACGGGTNFEFTNNSSIKKVAATIIPRDKK